MGLNLENFFAPRNLVHEFDSPGGALIPQDSATNLSPEDQSSQMLKEQGPFAERDVLQAQETNLIKEAKERSAARGFEHWTLSPAQEKLLKDLIERKRKKTGAGVLLYGPPGTGKSVFAAILAAELVAEHPQRHGYDSTTAQSFKPAADLLAITFDQPIVHASDTYIKTLEDFSQETNQTERIITLRRLLQSIITRSTPKLATYSAKVRERWAEHFFGKQLGLKVLLESHSEHQVGTPEWISEVITEDTELSITKILLQKYKEEQQEIKLNGADSLRFTPLWHAAKQGYVYVVEEIDKAHFSPGNMGFGMGAEELLEPPNGRSTGGEHVVQIEGLPPLTVDSGFLLIATCNDLNKVPDNIQRRFTLVADIPSQADLIWQARFQLSDAEGNNVLHNRPQDEQELVQFLLWAEALGRHKTVAFSANAINLLCAELRGGASFITALDTVLKENPQINGLFRTVFNSGSKSLSAQLESGQKPFLSLAELNWMANGRQGIEGNMPSADMVNENTKLENRLRWSLDTVNGETILNFNLVQGQNTITGDDDMLPLSSSVLQETLRGSDISLNEKSWEIAAGSPLGGTVMIEGADNLDIPTHMLVAIDGATGMLVPINQINIDNEGREKSIPWNFEGQVLGAHFFSEESAIIVTQKQGGEIELIQLERNLSLKNQNSTVWQPSFEVVYSSEYAVDFMTHNKHCEVSITNDLLIISNDGSRLFSFALHNSAIQPWTPIQLEGPFLETEIGTAVGIKGNRQWLRR